MSFEIIGFMGRSRSGKDLCGDHLREKHGFVPVALADPLKRFCGLIFPFDPDTHLWGPSRYRNIPVEVDWVKASEILWEKMNGWIERLPLVGENLRPRFRTNLFDWFKACEDNAVDGKLSARIALQLLGTEYGRHFQNNLWVEYFYQNVAAKIRTGGIYRKYYGVTGTMFNTSRAVGKSTNLGDPLVPMVPRGIVITDLRFRNEFDLVRLGNEGRVVRLIRLSQEGKTSETDEVGMANHASETELLSIPLDQFDKVLRMGESVRRAKEKVDEMMEEFGAEARPGD